MFRHGLAALFIGLCCAGPASADAIRFVAYNLENYAVEADPETGLASKSAESRDAVAAVVGALEPDILGLCEIGPGASLEELRARLFDAGLDFPHALAVDGPDAARRLALLSRFPIVQDQSRPVVEFELGGLRLPMQRGILDATVDLGEPGHLRLVGVHLKSKREVPEFDQEEFRARELRELRKHLDAAFADNPGVLLLVWGDFNETKNHPAMRDLAGRRGAPTALTAAELADSRGDRWTHHWAAADLYSRIDFLFLSRRLAAAADLSRSGIADPPAWRLASDHRPLYLTLQWN